MHKPIPAELLIKYRLERWPYQCHAAYAHGVSKGMWSMWESGKRKIPAWLGEHVTEYMLRG